MNVPNFVDEMEGNVSVFKPMKKIFRLKRIGEPQLGNRDVIQENLKPLLHNVEKKKRAQELYYETQDSVSPLLREQPRGPVHQRLGQKKRMFIGTNVSSLLPKRRIQHRNLIEKPRGYSAQNRLNMIRQRQAKDRLIYDQLQSPQNNKKIFRLRRNQTPQSSNDITVQVNNSMAQEQPEMSVGRFQLTLTPHLQQAIREMQSSSNCKQVFPVMRVVPVATSISTNERFSMY